VSFFSRILNNGLVIVVIILGIYVGLTIYSDIDEFSNIILTVDYEIIIIALLLMSLSIFLLALRFHRLVQALGIKLSLKRNIMIYFVGLAFSITPASSGSIIKSHLIKKETGVPISKTIPIIFVEKWNELNSVLILLLILIFISAIFETIIVTIIGIILSVFFLGIMKNKKIFLIFKNIIKKVKFLNNLEDSIEKSQSSFNVILNSKNILEGFLLTTTSKVIESIAVFLVFLTVGIELDFVTVTEIYFTGILSGFLSFIPGGFGVTEASLLGLLTKFGNDFTLSTAAVILVRLVTIWFATLLGLVMSKFFIKNKIT